METFVTVVVLLAVIALGVFLIHRLNSQHGDRIAAFHYVRSGMPVSGPAPSVPRGTRGRAGASVIGGRRDLRRRTRAAPPPAPHQ